jgi:hypothetical protein
MLQLIWADRLRHTANRRLDERVLLMRLLGISLGCHHLGLPVGHCRLLCRIHHSRRGDLGRGDSLAHTPDWIALGGRLKRGGDGDLARPVPIVLQILPSMISLLIEDLVEFRRMGRLIQYLGGGTGLRAILVRGSGDLLPWARDAGEFSHPWIIGGRKVDHGKRSQTGREAREPWGKCLWMRQALQVRSVAIDDISVPQRRKDAGARGLCSGSIPCLRGAGPFLTCQVLLGEALLPGFALPVVIANPSAIVD